MIRPFDWRDFPALHRNRTEGIWLDSALALTRWMAFVPAGALLASLAPATGVFTYVATNEDNGALPVVGQFFHPTSATNARLTFLTPEEEVDSPDVPALLDYLAARAGERGAHHLLAEVNDRSSTFDVLRRAGYAIYARQRVWTLEQREGVDDGFWRPTVARDEYQVHHLYHTLVPALVQQIEPPPWEKMSGLVYENDGEILAYVHLSYGPKGVLAQPFVHPDTDHAEELLLSLSAAVQNARSRPIYLSVRSHQAWLAPFLDDLGFDSGPRQAVMVKRLAVPFKKFAAQPNPAGLEPAGPKVTTYIHETQKNNR